MTEVAPRTDSRNRPAVLIVDDDPDMADVIKEHLAADYRTSTAHDGADAVEHFVLARPDVVLLDLSMPRMNGLQALIEMRKLDPEAVIIVLTATQDVEMLATALARGAFSYLPKPFHRDYLMHLVAAAVSHSRRTHP
jgi:DNA-binding NtrC family response regulator